MKHFAFKAGTNIYDFFVLPTIRYEHHADTKFVTFEWLWWFAGVSWYREEA